jgi:pseudouridine synthase
MSITKHVCSHYRFYLLHKPIEMLCSTKEHVAHLSRRHVYSCLAENNIPATQKDGKKLGCVGRLDFLSSGALLFTDNSNLARLICSGSSSGGYKLAKTYHVVVLSRVSEVQLDILRSPLVFDGVGRETLPAEVCIVSTRRDDSLLRGTPGWQITLEVKLREGKYRQIRKLCRRSGLRVLTLHRVYLLSL